MEMAKQSMQRIVEAEQRADTTEASARTQGARIIQEAETEAEKIINAAKEHADKLIEARIGEAKADAAVIEQDAANEARSDAAALAKNAEKNHDNATDLIIDALANE